MEIFLVLSLIVTAIIGGGMVFFAVDDKELPLAIAGILIVVVSILGSMALNNDMTPNRVLMKHNVSVPTKAYKIYLIEHQGE